MSVPDIDARKSTKMNRRNAGNVSFLFAASPVTIAEALSRAVPFATALVAGMQISEAGPRLVSESEDVIFICTVIITISLPVIVARFLVLSSVRGVRLIFWAPCQQLAR